MAAVPRLCASYYKDLLLYCSTPFFGPCGVRMSAVTSCQRIGLCTSMSSIHMLSCQPWHPLTHTGPSYGSKHHPHHPQTQAQASRWHGGQRDGYSTDSHTFGGLVSNLIGCVVEFGAIQERLIDSWIDSGLEGCEATEWEHKTESGVAVRKAIYRRDRRSTSHAVPHERTELHAVWC